MHRCDSVGCKLCRVKLDFWNNKKKKIRFLYGQPTLYEFEVELLPSLVKKKKKASLNFRISFRIVFQLTLSIQFPHQNGRISPKSRTYFAIHISFQGKNGFILVVLGTNAVLPIF